MSHPPLPDTPEAQREVRLGLLAALTAYLTWGLLVIYFKALEPVPPFLILAHRAVWSVLVLGGLITLLQGWGRVKMALQTAKIRWSLCATAALIGVNWFVFIWAVVSDRVLSASLGYYINPLVNVLFGVLFLQERLRRWQMVAIAIAALGVINQGVSIGAFPGVSVFLAVTFAIYGLIRKTAHVDAVTGLFIEVVIISIPALMYFAWLWQMGMDLAPVTGPVQMGLLLASGVITPLPLVMFTIGAKRLSLTTIGIIQYLAPTLQFATGVYVYGEAFETEQLITFALIWLAVVIFSWDAYRAQRRRRASQAA